MNNEDKTILYLDDEPENLDGFKFIFYKDYKIYTAQNVLEALNIIRNHPIKVILSDNKMPDMLGTEFFEMLTTSNPDIIRILVTAYVDTEAAMQAINKGQVYRFITKPWEKNELKATLENAFEAYNLKTQNQELIENLTRKNFELEDLNFRLMIEVSERKKVEEELYMHRNHLEELVKKRTQEIEKINQELTLYKEKLEKLVKERTEQLLESEQRIKTINDNLPGGAIFRGYTKPDNTDHLVYASNQIAEVTGISLDELLISIGHFFNNINREDIPLLVEARNESLKNFQPLDVELRYNKNDEIIWLHLRMMFSKSNDDNIWWDGYVIDITNRKIAEKAAKEREATINKIHEGIATKTGEKLLETIVIKLWETLKADSVFIGLPIKNNTIIRTTILCIDGKITKNFEYNIENSPCQIVLNNFTLSYRSGVYNHYPDSQLLKTFSAEGYIGTPLHNSAGSCIGILVALYKKTIVELKQAEQLLDIFSSRIGAEIERINAENEIQLYSDVALNMQVGLNVFQIEKNKNKYILKLIKANPAAEKITRLQLKNMVGMTFEEIYPQLKSYELHRCYKSYKFWLPIYQRRI